MESLLSYTDFVLHYVGEVSPQGWQCDQRRSSHLYHSRGCKPCMPYVDGKRPRPLGGAHKMAGATGLEPATSDVTGRRSNQLNYAPNLWLVSFQRTFYPGSDGLNNIKPATFPGNTPGRSNQLNYAPKTYFKFQIVDFRFIFANPNSAIRIRHGRRNPVIWTG